MLQSIICSLLPCLLGVLVWFTREWTVDLETRKIILRPELFPVPENTTSLELAVPVDPRSLVLDWSLDAYETPRHLFDDSIPQCYNWNPLMSMDRITALMIFMRKNTPADSAFSMSVEFGSNVNMAFWPEEDVIMINLAITSHSIEKMICGDRVNGQDVLFERYRTITIQYYDRFFDRVTKVIQDEKTSCLVQLLIDQYTSHCMYS